MKAFHSFFIFIFIFYALNGLSYSNDLVKDGDVFWKTRHIDGHAQKALSLYQNLASTQKNPQILIKYARSLHYYGSFMIPKKEKKQKIQYFTECIQQSTLAAQLNSSDLMPFLVMAVCYSERAKTDRSLSDAKNAKTILESIVQKNPEYMGAIALTILGKIYYELPGWPISDGSNAKALKLLRQAMAINSNNRFNYQYLADILWSEGEKNEAREVFKKGFLMPLDPSHVLEDKKCLDEMKEKYSQYME